MEFAFNKKPCGTPVYPDEEPPDWYIVLVDNFHYLYFGIFLCLLTMMVSIAVSLATPAIDEEHLYRLTFWSRHSEGVRDELDIDDDISVIISRSGSDAGIHSRHPSSESSGGAISKTLDLFCGPHKGPRNELTLEDSSTTIAATLRVPMTRGQLAKEAAIFLKESDEWERFVDINAVTVLCVTVFVIFFYY